jgi:RNA polymerase sigma-70 factor (ECF subfamily)
MDAASEEELLAAFSEGDAARREAVFEELYRRLGPGLDSLCRRMLGNGADAHDALQEVLLAVHRGLATFRGDAKLSTWACRIAVRTALHRRARVRRAPASLDFDPSTEANTAARRTARTEPADEAEEAEAARALERAILELRPAYRAVFSLASVDGMSAKEIGLVLGLPEGTVWTHLHRARKELAAKLARWL